VERGAGHRGPEKEARRYERERSLEQNVQESGRRGIFFQLLVVAVFNLLHQGFALEKVALEIGGEMAGHDEKLIAEDLGKRNGAARGNEMRAPLEDQADVPERSGGEKGEGGGASGAGRAEELRGAIEKNGEAENEKGSERNEKTVAVRRDSGPIGVAGDEKIKSEKGGKQRNADARFAAAEEEKPREGEKKDGSPGKKTVIGGEEHAKENGRGPEPLAERNISGFQRTSVNQIARDESGKKTEEERGGEQKVAEEEFGEARNCGGFGGGCAITECGAILTEGFDGEDGEDHGVGVVNVEHEASDCGKDQPLGKRARGARLVPIPNKKGNGDSGMRVGPGGIEIHVDGKRAGPPDGEGGEKRPALLHILAGDAEGQ